MRERRESESGRKGKKDDERGREGKRVKERKERWKERESSTRTKSNNIEFM